MYSMLVLGVIGAGGRFTGCNPAYTAAELNHHIRITNARFLITDIDLYQKVTIMVEQSSIPPTRVFFLEPADQTLPANCNCIQDLLKNGEVDWVRLHSAEIAKSTTAALLSTSGTTGFPKAAMMSHYSCIVLSHLLSDSKQKPYEVRALDLVLLIGLIAW